MVDIAGITIEKFDVGNFTDRQVARINAYFNEMKAESRPEDPDTPLEETAAFLANIPSFIQLDSWGGFDADDRMVCGAQGIGFPEGDNSHVLQCEMGVLAEHRRTGIGRELLRLLVAAAERNDKRLLIGVTRERVEDGVGFCRRVGAEAGMDAHTNRLVLGDVDPALVQRWIEEGPQRAPDYELIGFDGRCPDELVEEVVDVLGVMNDAPRDDLDVGDTEFTVPVFRQMEKMGLAQGNEYWRLYARHLPSGRLAGLTDVSWNPNTPRTVFQMDTGVRPEHRGKALGKWLKATMLQRILDERSEAEEIRTGNADSNAAMLAINHQLGFEPYIAATTWQIDTATARAYLD